MRKVFKIIGITLLVILLLIVGFIAYVLIRLAIVGPEIMVPENYETEVQTGGVIEANYLAHGAHEVTYFEEETDEKWAKYEVYYPSDLTDNNEKYPVIVVANGSGIKASRYIAAFEHYASWGFIVIGNEHDTAYAGDSTDASLTYLIEANDDPKSVLYQKVDLENVGTVGHSQGGVGVFNAITTQQHSDIYKTAVALSPVGEETAINLKWTYKSEEIQIPVMILAGEEKDVITLEQLELVYSHIGTDKVMAVRSNANHPEMLYISDGYVTAWMMWQLQGDEEAAKVFVGENPEILNNPLYQDQRININ